MPVLTCLLFSKGRIARLGGHEAFGMASEWEAEGLGSKRNADIKQPQQMRPDT